MRQVLAHRRPIEKFNSAMRRFGWRIAAFENQYGGCEAPDSKSDLWLLRSATDPAFAAPSIIARRTALACLRFI